MAVACTFSVRSANHGYKFLYLSLHRRLHIGQLRSRLRQPNINIHHSDCYLIALQTHNDYEVELRSQLKKFKIPVQDD